MGFVRSARHVVADAFGKVPIRSLDFGGRSERNIFSYRGVHLDLPANLLTPRIRDAFERGYYEAAEADEVPHILQPGERVLEIGSAIGFLATLVAKTGKASSIIAVEANPALVEISRRTFALNKVDVEVHHELLDHEEGEGELFVHPDFWSSSTRRWEGARRVCVPKKVFQQRLAEWRPTLILVDIEGGEETLFDGVDLTGVQRVMMEVHQENIGRIGMKRVFDAFSAQNFHYDQWHSSKGIVTFTSVLRP